ncbi:MAG TPA: B12-binding domain-containing radical SAM protein [Candidatus Omnitrophota bacterium]|nr:B12-binding domain-containing radical SAM protein [Candidatus Omnitrophota bacterium]
MKPLRIYLCDLTHYVKMVVNDTIPLNIAFIASYLKKQLGESVEISLFKLPLKAIQALKDSPPDVLALSNYCWNSHLSEHVAGIGKRLNPNMVTLQGGANFPHDHALQLPFVLQRPNTDIFLEFEGEVSFCNVIRQLLLQRDPEKGILKQPLAGCVYLAPGSRTSKHPQLITGGVTPRLKNLDEIPSPYLTGLLDPFFDGVLTPFIETNRGCPFTCSYCHTSHKYFNPIAMFSVERIVNEIDYIAPRAGQLGIVNLHIADTNFGMYPRDKEIAEALYRTQRKYGWPRQILASTGKNNKERVIQITDLMGESFPVTMAVQSMEPKVLKNIHRDNIKIEHFSAITKHLQKKGRITRGEMIIGLPGESKETFVRGVRQLMDAGITSMCIYSLMLLQGTEFQDPEYRKKFGIQGKFRIVPLNFGEYDGKRIFDYEEVGIATKDMPFEDYLWLRGLCLFVETLYSDSPFQMLFHYARDLGIKTDDMILGLYAAIPEAPQKIRDIVNDFLKETRDELWDSEEDLIEFFMRDENYEKLLRGELGGNLIYKYKSLGLALAAGLWAEHIGNTIKKIVSERPPHKKMIEQLHQEIDTLVSFEKNRLAGCIDSEADTSPISMLSPYDLLKWHKAEEQTPLSHFSGAAKIHYVFEYTDEQMKTRQDLFKRYGTSVSALSKIITRVGNVHSLFRTVRAVPSQS